MELLKKSVYILCLLAFMCAGYGCESEGPAEKAGKKIDQTIEEVADSVEDAGDKIEDAAD